jgi:hypothetical protein
MLAGWFVERERSVAEGFPLSDLVGDDSLVGYIRSYTQPVQ